MSENNSILEQLRKKNPFLSAISPSPFENKTADFSQLNIAASDEIEQLLRTKRREPEMPLAGLVIGEPGTGKTHMLARILRRVRSDERPITFAVVNTHITFTSPHTITQDLWVEILKSLSQSHSNNHSQFDLILEKMIETYKECRINDGFSDLSKLDMRIYLAKDMLGINKDFLKCIMLYLNAKDEITRMKIFEWLQDGLEDEESIALGLPKRDLHDTAPEICENTARKFLLSLGCVLGYAHVSMLLCFDQVEEIRDKNIIHAFGDTISFIMNDLSGIMPLCFTRNDIWNEIFRPELDSSVIQRLEHHKMILKNCSPSEAKSLVKTRLASVFKEDLEEKYNWLINRLNNKLLSGCSPRMVIELADHIIRTTDTLTKPNEILFDTFKTIYESECTKIHERPNSWLPNSTHLASSLNIWLKSHQGFETKLIDNKYIKITGNYQDRKYAFIIITAKNHSTAVAGIKRGINFLNEYNNGICFYITESRTHKNTWKSFKAQQDIFERLGGQLIILNNDSRHNWYALASLINQIESGDVNLYLNDENRTAKLIDALNFIKTLELLPIFSAKKQETASQINIHFDNDNLRDNLLSVVKSSPMNILTVDKAINFLADKNINISRNDLLSFISNNKGHFRTYQAKSGSDVMIGLTTK